MGALKTSPPGSVFLDANRLQFVLATFSITVESPICESHKNLPQKYLLVEYPTVKCMTRREYGMLWLRRCFYFDQELSILWKN